MRKIYTKGNQLYLSHPPKIEVERLLFCFVFCFVFIFRLKTLGIENETKMCGTVVAKHAGIKEEQTIS